MAGNIEHHAVEADGLGQVRHGVLASDWSQVAGGSTLKQDLAQNSSERSKAPRNPIATLLGTHHLHSGSKLKQEDCQHRSPAPRRQRSRESRLMSNCGRKATKLREMISGYMISQVISATAALGLADLLAEGTEERESALAEATGTHEPSLLRLLRALSACGLTEE